MTESRDGVDPPFCKRSVQLTIAAFGLVVSLWQIVSLSRLTHHAQNQGAETPPTHRWGELAGRGHPLIQIDINRAGANELSLLPGVGPILARRIVEHRQRFGPFESLHALSRVHGIGDKTIEEIGVLGDVDRDSSRGAAMELRRGNEVEMEDRGVFDPRRHSATMQGDRRGHSVDASH